MDTSRISGSLVRTLAAGFSVALGSAGCGDGEPAPPFDAGNSDEGGYEAGEGPDAASDAPCDPSEPCFLFPDTCAEGDFCVVPVTYDTRGRLLDVWGSLGTSDLWVVGSSGTILYKDTTWSQLESGVPETLFSVGGTGPNDVWVAAGVELMLHGPPRAADGGLVWGIDQADPTAFAGPIYKMWSNGTSGVWAAVDTTSSLNYVPTPVLHASSFGSAGSTWDSLTDEWRDLCFSFNPNGCDGGRGIFGTDDGVIWVVGQRGFAARGAPRDSGHEWRIMNTQSRLDAQAVWAPSGDEAWAVGNGGTIRHWQNHGTQVWSIIESPVSTSLFGIWGSSAEDIWMVGEAGVILHCDSSSCVQVPVAGLGDNRPTFRSVWGRSASEVWAVGDTSIVRLQKGAP